MSIPFDERALFVEVARKRSFVRAAESLNLSVSTVSRAVGGLEARLGVRLLQRTTRRVGLTEAGAGYFERCESLLAELHAADAEASAMGEQLSGHLRLSVATGFGMVSVVPALPDFLARHPRLSVDLDLSNRYVDLVEERFDVAIRVGTLADSRLTARRLGPNRRVLAASSEYLRRHGMPAKPSGLASHACLVLDVGPHPQRWQLSRGAAHSLVEITGPLRSKQCHRPHGGLHTRRRHRTAAAVRAGAGTCRTAPGACAAPVVLRGIRHLRHLPRASVYSRQSDGIRGFPGCAPAHVGA